MTITLSPDQEQAIRDAIRAGRIASVDEFIEHAIAALPGAPSPGKRRRAARSSTRAWACSAVRKTPPCSTRLCPSPTRRDAGQVSEVHCSEMAVNGEITPTAADY